MAVGRGTQERQRLCSLNRCDRNILSLCLDIIRAAHCRTRPHEGDAIEGNRLSWSYTCILQCLGRVTIAPGIEIGSSRVIIIADATVVEDQLVRVAVPIVPVAIAVPIVSTPVVPLRVGAGEINGIIGKCQGAGLSIDRRRPHTTCDGCAIDVAVGRCGGTCPGPRACTSASTGASFATLDL